MLTPRCPAIPAQLCTDGLIVELTEDGPAEVACLGCPRCRIAARVRRAGGDVLLGAGAAADDPM